jgi:cobalt-zinc-cadmium resistance protein CzcA
MLTRFITASFHKPLIACVLALAGAILGGAAMRDLPRDVFPDLSAPVFNVIVQNPAMNADELEMRVAVPFETALSGLPQVRRVRSSSTLGVVQITVEFEPDADHARARQYVAERLAQVELPPGTDAPLLSGVTGRLNEIFELTVEAKPGVADLMVLRDLAEHELKNRLLAVPGVAAVERLGGYLREFQIQLDPPRMAARGVTLDEVLHAARGANASAAGGLVTQAQMEWTVQASGRARDVAELRDTVVALRGGTPVRLGDVAEVREAPAVRRGIAHRLDGEVVSCRIVKQFAADTVAVARGIRAALAELRLPAGVEIRIVYDQSELVSAALGGVGRAVLIGAGLVALVLFGLLGNARAALIVTLTLPLSLALAGLGMRFAGIGINTMTLGGLAIAVGLLVDSSIIVVENVVHRIAAGGDRRGRALAAAVEVGRPIAFATAVVTAVFLPLFAMSGIEGRMYQPLAGAVIAAVLAALVLALAVVPVVAAGILRPRPDADVWLIRVIKRGYRPVLERALRRGRGVLAIAALATAPALWLATRLGSDFVPPLDEGAILMQTFLPPEASLDEVDRLNHRVEDVLRAAPEVADVVRRTGRAERTEDPMPHTVSDVLILLRPDRARTGEPLVDALREAVARVPGVSARFTTPLGMRIDEGLGGTPADLAIRIFGPDAQQLADLGDAAAAVLRRIDGLTDVRAEPLIGLPQLTVQVDREAAARVGLTPGDVVEAVQTGLVGQRVSEMWLGQRRFDLTVVLAPDFRRDAAALGALIVDGHDGTRIPLGKLAKIEPTFGLGTIRREAGMRRIAVEASVTGRDLGSAAREARAALAALALPPGYFLDVGGKVESQARAQQALVLAIGLALLAVFLLLYGALGSLAETAVILATLPSAFVGGIVALALAGQSWSVSSLVGLIGLFGIAVQNGLVLVSQTRALIAEGHAFTDALREACIGRVRPKLLTAATAILGLLPLLVLRLHGTEIERPLAIVMIGGLVTSTAFTLIALPACYQLVHQLGVRWRSR